VIRARKLVDTRRVTDVVARDVELFDDVEHRPPKDDDDGELEVLPDGTVSIPLFEDEVVVSKQSVVRERVLVEKVPEVETYRVQARLRRERVDA